jgi:hypothetical protein
MRVYQFRHFGKGGRKYRSFCAVVQRQISPHQQNVLGLSAVKEWRWSAQETPAACRYRQAGSNCRHLRKIGSDMPIPYCSVHERLFVRQKNAWMNWSQDYVSMVKHICDTFDSANILFSDYKVIESPCDLCIEIARQLLHEQWEKLGPRQ